jgi:hypothetical protein
MDANKPDLMKTPLKVLYIAGEWRSGSTILANVLGQMDGFFHAGEIGAIWLFGLQENVPCSCGARFQSCPVWQEIFDRAFGGMHNVDAKGIFGERLRGLRSWRIPQLLLPNSRSFIQANLANYVRHLGKLYKAIHDVTGCRAVIDSTKVPTDLKLLRELPGVDPYVVHLIRDPRAVAYSFQRKRRQPGTDIFQRQYHPARASFRWNLWNVSITASKRGLSGRYRRLFYEDFIDNPKATLRLMESFLQLPPSPLPFLDGQFVTLKENHGIWGNPNRVRTGQVELRRDDEWQREMSAWSKWMVTSLTWPLCARYGYPMTTGGQRKSAIKLVDSGLGVE